jgi:hypothetical protein
MIVSYQLEIARNQNVTGHCAKASLRIECGIFSTFDFAGISRLFVAPFFGFATIAKPSGEPIRPSSDL